MARSSEETLVMCRGGGRGLEGADQAPPLGVGLEAFRGGRGGTLRRGAKALAAAAATSALALLPRTCRAPRVGGGSLPLRS